MQALFEAVREACDAATWSRGVSLAREDAVVGERQDDQEVVLRVAQRGAVIAPQVRLYPDDEDWDCDCPEARDPCDHVAAAVIALRQARADGRPLPGAADAPGRVGYRLARTPTGLHFERCIVTAEGDHPLRGSVASLASGAMGGPRFTAQAVDLRLEKRLAPRLHGVFARENVGRLLENMVGVEDIQLDGEPITVSIEAVLPRAVVDDRGDGFAIEIQPAADVDETFANGLALCQGVLRPIGDARLSLREREQLAGGRYFAPDEVALLMSEVLPSLEERLAVEVRTQRLPSSERVPPRVVLRTQRHGDDLEVLPSVVYGDPPNAEIVDGRLKHLRGSVPRRNHAAEQELRVWLKRELGLVAGHSVQLPTQRAIQLAEQLQSWHGNVEGRAHQEFFLAPELHPDLCVREDDFEVSFQSGSSRRAEAQAVLGAWRAGASLVALDGGGFAPLPQDWLARFGDQVSDLLAAREARDRLPQHALPDLALLCEELELPAPPGFARLRPLVEGFDGIPDAELPADLRADLRPYQRRGVSWLAFLRQAGLGGLLADDMGLGKTLQALCALDGRALVVAPTSVVHAWTEQAARFRPDLRLSVYHGARRSLDPQADLTLTTYAILRLDAERLASVTWDTVVLDEAQAIKNPDSQVARAAFRLDARFRVTMTGTPVENRLEELWSQLAFSNPGLLGNRRDFQERVAQPIASGEPGAAGRLRRRIAPFVLRRLKAEVAPELPPRTEVVLQCELTDPEREVYDAIRAATQQRVTEQLRRGGNVLEALEALLRLRQAACHSGLVPGQRAQGSSKLDLLRETLDEVVAEGHKALVFSQWTSLLDRIEPELRAARLGFTRLDGSTADRGAVVEDFQAPDGPPVLLISLRAGGTGLSLTAADHVFLVDPWWNPAVEDQAADRAHRIGQTRPVLIHRLVARDTVEERILALQGAKRELADAALGGADRAAAISREELLALLDD